MSKPALPLNPDKIGVLVPLNGPNAKYGDMVIRGLNLAVSDWNEGHPGQQVTLVIKDAGSEPDIAARSFKELVAKGRSFGRSGAAWHSGEQDGGPVGKP